MENQIPECWMVSCNAIKLDPSQIAMVGDRIYTDIRMAHDAKALGVLVLSGETTIEITEQSNFKPDVVVEDLEEFGEMIKRAYRKK